MMMLVWMCALLCLQLGLAVGQISTVNPPASRICRLDGFDLNTLQLASYWKFTVSDKDQCLIPPGVTTDDVHSCTINFAVCHTVPASLCTGESSSMCQEVLLANGIKYDYSIGTYDSSHTYKVKGNGFVAERTGEEVANSSCNGNFSTIFIFTCNAGATWSTKQHDVTSHLSSIVRNPAHPCQYLIEVTYSGACYSPPTLAPNHCQLDGYDLATLANQDYWYADVHNSLCLNATDTCRFYFAFCHPVPPVVKDACYDNGVCQVGDDNSTLSYGMGLFQNTTMFYPNVGVIGGGFHVDYQNGSAPSFLHTCTAHGLRSRVVLTCNSSMVWTQPDQSSNIHVFWDRTYDICMYVFEFQYAGACVPVGPTTTSVVPLPSRIPMTSPIVNSCSLDGYDLSVLQQASYWKFTVSDKDQCLIPPGVTTDDVQSCTINFAICPTVAAGSLCAGENSSMCQEVILSNGTKYGYSMGSSCTYHLQENGDGFAAERTGMEVTSMTGCNGNVSTVFTFTCDTSATWSTSQPDVTSHLSSILRNGCQYLIEFQYSGACHLTTQAVDDRWVYVVVGVAVLLVLVAATTCTGGVVYCYKNRHPGTTVRFKRVIEDSTVSTAIGIEDKTTG